MRETMATLANRRNVLALAMAAVALLGSLAPAPASAAVGPGDIIVPAYADGEWWNYSVEGPDYLPLHLGANDVTLNRSSGNLKLEVRGTASRLGRLAWEIRVVGTMQLSGMWTGQSGGGLTGMTAEVSGWEWRSVDDLSLLGSTRLYSGLIEISSYSSSERFNVAEWVNVTLSQPLRLMTLPVPFSQSPLETHTVEVTHSYEAQGFALTRVRTWEYEVEYKGIVPTVQGRTNAFSNQHMFDINGNIIEAGRGNRLDGAVYYDAAGSKMPSVDELSGMEMTGFQLRPGDYYPDLVTVAPEFTVSNAKPVLGTNVTFNATVHNLGARNLRQVRVELWASSAEGFPSKVNGTDIGQLNGYDSAQVRMNWTSTDLGSWRFTLRLDPSSNVEEEREYNNDLDLNLTVVRLVVQSNLVLTPDDIVLDPASPVDNRTAVHVSASVLNLGPASAYNVTVDFFLGNPAYGGAPIGWRSTIDYIAAGKTGTAWINWLANIPGEHDIWAVVDANNSINETVETDNVARTPIIIIASPFGGVDLTMVRLKVLDAYRQEAAQLPSGDHATIEVIILNNGPQNASRVHLSVYVDALTPAGLVGSFESAITAHLPVVWTVPWTIAGTEGNHTVFANVIALGQAEGAFDDNTRTLKFTIGPREQPPPDTLVVTIFPETTMLDPGQNLRVSGKVVRMSNGADVENAEVTLTFEGSDIKVTTTTNVVGRYLVSISAPGDGGDHRLEVSVKDGYNVGTGFVLVNVQQEVVPPPPDGDGDGGRTSWTVMALLAVVVAAVVGPIAYVGLSALQKRRARFRKVHETVVTIEEKK